MGAEAHAGHWTFSALAASSSEIGCPPIQFEEVFTLHLIHAVLLAMNPIVRDPFRILRLVEEQPFEGLALEFAESEFVAHDLPPAINALVQQQLRTAAAALIA